MSFQGAQPNGGRPRIPKPTELARQLVERHAAAILRPHFKALGLHLADDGTTTPLEQGAIVVHQGEATLIEDLAAQISAAERLLDRVYGRPRQQLEHTGEGGGPVEISAPEPIDAAERSRRAAVLLAEIGGGGAPVPTGPLAANGYGTANGNGNGHHEQ